MIYSNNVADLTLGNIGQNSTAVDFEAEYNYKALVKKRFRLLNKARELLPDEKGLQSCCLHAAPNAKWIQANYVPETKAAYFGGLKHCGSCNCPACTIQISEQDRREITIALAEAQRRGMFAYHLIFTLAHSWSDALEDERQALNTTLKRMFAGGWFTRFMAEIGYVGRIRAYEATFRTGWHFHSHIILIMEKPPIPERLEADLFKRYSSLLQQEGFSANAEHGVRVEAGQSALADYVAKWGHDPVLHEPGLEDEIASARLKKGKGGLTPFELLAVAAGESEPLEKLRGITNNRYSDAQLIGLGGELYVEYFETMKGKPRLVWSDGLRGLLEIEQALDWYEAENPPAEALTLVELEAQDGWKVVRGAEGEDLRADFLYVVHTGDMFQIVDFLYKKHIRAIVYPDGNLYNPIEIN